MKIYLVSYANERFVPDQALLAASALRFGVTDVRPWSQQMLHRTAFYSENKAILDLERGAGYWLWKPFIISETLKEMEEGDCLIYSDSGMKVVADLTPLFRIALERDLVFFSGTGQCRQWTKRDCFYFLNADEPLFHEAQMVDASFLVLAKNSFVNSFMAEWLKSCRDPRILTDEPNTSGLPDLPGFIEHRHDQSVLSIFARRGNFEMFRHPSQFGNHSKSPEYRVAGEWTGIPYASEPFQNSPYGTLLDHHRGKLFRFISQSVRWRRDRGTRA
jgi:hypothetical protein